LMDGAEWRQMKRANRQDSATALSECYRLCRGHEPCAIVLAVRIQADLTIFDAHVAIADLMSWPPCNLLFTRCTNNRNH
jgi:hypothetical protein